MITEPPCRPPASRRCPHSKTLKNPDIQLLCMAPPPRNTRLKLRRLSVTLAPTSKKPATGTAPQKRKLAHQNLPGRGLGKEYVCILAAAPPAKRAPAQERGGWRCSTCGRGSQLPGSAKGPACACSWRKAGTDMTWCSNAYARYAAHAGRPVSGAAGGSCPSRHLPAEAQRPAGAGSKRPSLMLSYRAPN